MNSNLKKTYIYSFFIILSLMILSPHIKSGEDKKMKDYKYNKLTTAEKRVIIDKGTEYPNTGEYNKFFEKGVYLCKQCDAPLYKSENKFDSHCGWPAFDDEIKGAVSRIPDKDGRRTEIVCSRCNGHLGHVFTGEGFTSTNTRHCVNSISMKFVYEKDLGRAIFASGCFWGTEYHFEKAKGVISATSGYTGGSVSNPGYRAVCTGSTGHAEAVEVIYDPSSISYEELTKLFFETHDPGQLNRQGPDIGTQYRSEIFYLTEAQKKTAEKLIKILKDKGHKVVTKLTKAEKFWNAEDYHQNYYDKKGGTPYCHIYRKKF